MTLFYFRNFLISGFLESIISKVNCCVCSSCFSFRISLGFVNCAVLIHLQRSKQLGRREGVSLPLLLAGVSAAAGLEVGSKGTLMCQINVYFLQSLFPNFDRTYKTNFAGNKRACKFIRHIRVAQI